MTVIANILPSHNQPQLSEQEYLLALDAYDLVLKNFSTDSVNKLRAARRRRNIAYHRFMESMR